MDEVAIVIIPKDLYDVWAEGEDCFDFLGQKLVTIEDRRELAKAEGIQFFPNDPFTNEDDIDEYIAENIENFPLTLTEFDELYEGVFTEYTSKSGDEIIVICYTPDY